MPPRELCSSKERLAKRPNVAHGERRLESSIVPANKKTKILSVRELAPPASSYRQQDERLKNELVEPMMKNMDVMEDV